MAEVRSQTMDDTKHPHSLEQESARPLKERIELLVAEMRASLEAKGPFDLSKPPHREITEALRRLVYEEGVSAQLQVAYSDNTRGEPFPVRVLRFPDSRLAWKNKL